MSHHENPNATPQADRSLRHLEVLLHEFDRLKEEQRERIKFRDELIRATLIAVGGVWAFVLTDSSYLSFVLVIPWIVFVLGWTYYTNDEKVSAIGRYIRGDLSQRIANLIGQVQYDRVFGWEIAHAADPMRPHRKWTQWFVDFVTFIASGVAAILYYWVHRSSPDPLTTAACAVECFLLLVLVAFISKSADTLVRTFRRAR